MDCFRPYKKWCNLLTKPNSLEQQNQVVTPYILPLQDLYEKSQGQEIIAVMEEEGGLSNLNDKREGIITIKP